MFHVSTDADRTIYSACVCAARHASTALNRSLDVQSSTNRFKTPHSTRNDVTICLVIVKDKGNIRRRDTVAIITASHVTHGRHQSKATPTPSSCNSSGHVSWLFPTWSGLIIMHRSQWHTLTKSGKLAQAFHKRMIELAEHLFTRIQ